MTETMKPIEEVKDETVSFVMEALESYSGNYIRTILEQSNRIGAKSAAISFSNGEIVVAVKLRAAEEGEDD